MPAIKTVVESLTTLEYPASQVGIQFISFGEDKVALRQLEQYRSDLELKSHVRDPVRGL